QQPLYREISGTKLNSSKLYMVNLFVIINWHLFGHTQIKIGGKLPASMRYSRRQSSVNPLLPMCSIKRKLGDGFTRSLGAPFDRSAQAAGDAGGMVGAALAAWHQFLGKERKTNGKNDLMPGTLLGPAFAQGDIERRLTDAGAQFSVVPDEDVKTATLLADGEAVGWMQGRMEFGPRARSAPARSWMTA